MPRFYLLLCVLSLAVGLCAPPSLANQAGARPAGCVSTAGQVRLQIIVSGVRNAKGAITIMLYGDRKRDFLKKGKRIGRIRIPAQAGEVAGCMLAPAPGSYAITLYHDEDANRKLTKNWLGLPTEGYGFSRNAPVTYRLPELEDAVFTALPGDNAVRIRMRY